MRLEYQAISHPGLKRTVNQDMALIGNSTLRDDSDSFAFDLPDEGIVFPVIVCDGLGGRPEGEAASQTVCDSLKEFTDSLAPGLDDNEVISAIKAWAAEANRTLLGRGTGLATTVTGLLIYHDRAYLLNAGDSRTYRLRYENFRQLSTDHSERDRTGDLSIPGSVMYNCLGLESAFIDVQPTRIVPGDLFIICSDGLSDLVAPEVIAATPDARALLEAALAAGGYDNTTIIILKAI